MGFLSIKSQSIFLTIDNKARVVRPLAEAPLGKWVFNIPTCKVVPEGGGKEKTIRYYRVLDADFSQWPRNNPDPLWPQLDNRDQYNNRGERVDFPMRPIHYLPVWSYSDEDIKIVRQGNQYYEEMAKYADAGNNVMTCDWVCWTEGDGRFREYKVTRNDSSPFTIQLDQNVVKEKINALMEQALKDILPFSDEAAMIAYISGQGNPQNRQVTGGSVPAQIPGYQPGGQSQVNLGNPVAQLPAANPPAQQTQPPVQMAQPPVQVSQPPVQVSQPPTQFVQNPMQPAQPTQVVPDSGPQNTMVGTAQPMPQGVPAYQPAQPDTMMAQGFIGQPPQAQIQTEQPAYVQPAQMQPTTVEPTPEEVPNAPVSTSPVLAPPVTAQPQVQEQPSIPTTPGETVLDFGKYSGKNLLHVRDNDPNYLNFLKSNKKHLVPEIDAMLSVPHPVRESVENPPTNGVTEEQRMNLAREINDRLMKIPDLTGPNIQNLFTFLTNSIGDANFIDAPYDKLVLLKTKIHESYGAQ